MGGARSDRVLWLDLADLALRKGRTKGFASASARCLDQSVSVPPKIDAAGMGATPPESTGDVQEVLEAGIHLETTGSDLLVCVSSREV